MEKKYLSTIEAARLLGISRIAVFKKIKAGQIKARKAGRNYIIPKEKLADVLEASLNDGSKKRIEAAVKKTVAEYGDTLRLLGQE
ncbi:helix-turn-helix domain-containing protein [Candidatus Gottesmanbacteria bacterium]|nr:helix-turn-helix domain-containing protein [Candidatus Gottesmanbacteria bacterium]